MNKTIFGIRRQEEGPLREKLRENAEELIRRKLAVGEKRAKNTAAGKNLRRERARLLTVLREKEVLRSLK